jgi:copper chaperone CopZ
MKLPVSALAPLVVALFFGIVLMGSSWELPSMQKKFGETEAKTASVSMIVDGLHCRGTSNFFMKVAEKIPGVISVSTYVQEHRAEIDYDPSATEPDKIAEAIQKPVTLANGRTVAPFKVKEIAPK